MWRLLFIALFTSSVTASFTTDDRFLKKYALIKIFESCFGQDVVREIRKELKAACAKCSALENPLVLPQPQTTARPFTQEKLASGISDVENSLFSNPQSFSTDKLQQTILTFRPYQAPQLPFGPYPPPNVYQSLANPLPYFYNPNFQPNLLPFNLPPPFGQQYFSGSRMSRDMDFRGQLELLSARYSNRVKNITCVMQELGYLDENLEPDYNKITERISGLSIANDLKRDIQEGVTYCQQFSQCIPEPNKGSSPLSGELNKPMLFFKCYKYKKLEACVMKDVREKYSTLAEEDFANDGEFSRVGRSLEGKDEVDELTATLYDVIYGTQQNFEELF